jgi:hypothetical protein
MIEFRNAVFAEVDTQLNCEIMAGSGWALLHLDSLDGNLSPAHLELWTRASAVAVTPQIAYEGLMRKNRDYLLVAVVDAKIPNALFLELMDPDEKASLVTYRQALLDVPQQAGFPMNIVWPVKE